jgi:hypothetical protein
MASFVFSAIGGLFGGQIGSRIGGAIGKQVDAPAREGPRIKELDVQTSSYGNTIPQIFGVMRIAGTVIWSTDLIESSKRNGGKGAPKTIEYSYSVSFAVALSSRPALRVGRIWADGNLLRGAAGDFKTATQFRFYSGFGDQSLDPLIASKEGTNASPAYRGLCYAVFEDLQLADFGNRIPSLTFELFEREGELKLCDIVTTIGAKDNLESFVECSSAEILSGYVMQGPNGEAGLTPLIDNFPVFVRPNGRVLEILDWTDQQNVAVTPVIAANQNGRDLKRQEKQRDVSSIPETLALRHYDPARDYQIGVQRSALADGGRIAQQIDLPASLSATSARRLADLQLLSQSRRQSAWTAYIMRGETEIRAGDKIREPSSSELWQVTDIEHFGMASRISAQKPVAADAISEENADSGRNLMPPDLVTGATRLVLLDLPVITGGDQMRPLIAIAAASSAAGWRGAALSKQTANGLEEIGATAQPAVIGLVQNLLRPHSPNLIDMENVITVQLLNSVMELPEQEVALSDTSAPIFWLAGEIIRAQRTDYQGNGLYRLSHLQRGCFGTEDKISEHTTGETLLLLEANSLRLIESDDVSPGLLLKVEATGLGDLEPAIAETIIKGNAIRPFAPVHGRITKLAGGSVLMQWARRNRIDHGWRDGVDQPLDEDSELYQIDLSMGGAVIATFQASSPELTLSAAQIADLFLVSGQLVTIQICQIGRFAKSNPLTTSWTV